MNKQICNGLQICTLIATPFSIRQWESTTARERQKQEVIKADAIADYKIVQTCSSAVLKKMTEHISRCKALYKTESSIRNKPWVSISLACSVRDGIVNGYEIPSKQLSKVKVNQNSRVFSTDSSEVVKMIWQER